MDYLRSGLAIGLHIPNPVDAELESVRMATHSASLGETASESRAHRCAPGRRPPPRSAATEPAET
jgi:hypothetical protein